MALRSTHMRRCKKSPQIAETRNVLYASLKLRDFGNEMTEIGKMPKSSTRKTDLPSAVKPNESLCDGSNSKVVHIELWKLNKLQTNVIARVYPGSSTEFNPPSDSQHPPAAGELRITLEPDTT